MLKIVLTGPESTGKTTLAGQLAEVFNTVWVPEFARGYINRLNREYHFGDLVIIAEEQIKSELHFQKRANQILFCDTDIITVKIWSEVKYGQVDIEILEKANENNTDLYLLCKPDLPWEYDPQRESAGSLDKLFLLYKKELQLTGKPVFEIGGEGEKRLVSAIRAVKTFQKKIPTLK